MKSGFKDRSYVPEGKTIKNPWNFDCPPYDERTSCFISAGSNYGVGKCSPIGTIGNPKGPHAIPLGRVDTLSTDYVNRGGVPGLVEIKVIN
jgi:hypothetical protein